MTRWHFIVQSACLIVLLASASVRAGLHAAADDQYLYLTAPSTVTGTDGTEKTADILLRRERFSEGQWQRIRQLAKPANGLAVWKGDAVVLTDTGELRLVGPGRSTPFRTPDNVTAIVNVNGKLLAKTTDGVLRYDEAWVAADASDWPAQSDEIAVDFAGSRYVFTQAGDKIEVQAFDAGGKPLDDAEAIEFNVTPPQPPAWPIWALMIMLAATAWGTMSLRTPPPVPVEVKAVPATNGRRFVGGFIDMLLGYPPGMWFAYHFGITNLPAGTAVVVVLIGGFTSYLLLTATVEVATRRSIGKYLAGLRVVDLGGEPATRKALLTRNVLRIADVWPVFPLVIVVIHPLHQRLGDAAARTVVVDTSPKPDVEPDRAPTQDV